MFQRDPFLEKIWSSQHNYLQELLIKSNFDTSRISNFSIALNPIRGASFWENWPPNQSILFNPQFNMNFTKCQFNNNLRSKKFEIKLKKDPNPEQFILAAGFATPMEEFANFSINSNYCGSIIDITVKNDFASISGVDKSIRYIILPSLPIHFNPTTVEFFKLLNHIIITELDWKPINNTISEEHKIPIIGTDPEFELIKNGDVVRARDYFAGNEIGHDGAGNQLELRPAPSEDIDSLINNIKVLFQKVTNQSFLIGTAGHTIPIGSHIHFSGANFHPYPDYDFLKCLDQWLYEKLLPLNGLARGHFGQPSDQRRKLWGFEYRSLPSGIFTSPILAKAVFRIAKGLAEKWWNYQPITSNPSFSDFSEFLDSDEFHTFINASEIKLSNSQKCLKSFLANWNLKYKPKYEALILFRDDWPTRATSLLRLKCSFGDCIIVLFGLKQNSVFSITDKTSKIPPKVITEISDMLSKQPFVRPLAKIEFTHQKEKEIRADLLVGISPEFRTDPTVVNYIVETLKLILSKER